MIQPTNYNFTIYKGATFDQTFTWQDATGNVFDLSSYTDADLQIRTSVSAPDPAAISLTLGSGITLSSTSPNISLYISATDTSNITISSGVYDLTLTDNTGIVTRLLEGKVTIDPNVTKT